MSLEGAQRARHCQGMWSKFEKAVLLTAFLTWGYTQPNPTRIATCVVKQNVEEELPVLKDNPSLLWKFFKYGAWATGF